MFMTKVYSLITQCDPNLSVKEFYDHFSTCGNNSSGDVFIIGDACSVGTQPLAAMSSIWDILHVRMSVHMRMLSSIIMYQCVWVYVG